MFGMKPRPTAPKLGHLELRVMEIAWARADLMTVREFVTALGRDTVAVSTMQTTLERLTRKGLLGREKQGRAFAYRVQVERSALISQVLRDISDEFATGRIEPMLAGFLDLVDELDPERSEAVLEAIARRARRR